MSIFSRFINRVWPGRLARDLRDEVEFHIHMRADENRNAGMDDIEAVKQARRQFGDIGSVVSDMRKERLASTPMLFAMSALVLAVVVVWIVQQRMASSELRLPPVRGVSIFRDPNRVMGSPPPPRPGPGPTWTQFVKQSKAFEALQKGPGVYAPGRLIDDEGKLIDDEVKAR